MGPTYTLLVYATARVAGIDHVSALVAISGYSCAERAEKAARDIEQSSRPCFTVKIVKVC